MEKTYAEKLKDPRWQKKRLEILERDGWACTSCDAKDTELHVHHLKYNGNPWDAKNEDLETLCKDCHEMSTKAQKTLKYVKEVAGRLDEEQIEYLSDIINLLFPLSSSHDLLDLDRLCRLITATTTHFKDFSKAYAFMINIIENYPDYYQAISFVEKINTMESEIKRLKKVNISEEKEG